MEDPVTALDFVLQPLDLIERDIAQGARFEMELSVGLGDMVVWKFQVQSFDINFAVEFSPAGQVGDGRDCIHRLEKYSGEYDFMNKGEGGGRLPEIGTFCVVQPGTVHFRWDNSYSWRFVALPALCTAHRTAMQHR